MLFRCFGYCMTRSLLTRTRRSVHRCASAPCTCGRASRACDLCTVWCAWNQRDLCFYLSLIIDRHFACSNGASEGVIWLNGRREQEGWLVDKCEMKHELVRVLLELLQRGLLMLPGCALSLHESLRREEREAEWETLFTRNLWFNQPLVYSSIMFEYNQ